MLYIVSTPIGNLKDITLRALDALKGVDLILCEDTRVTSKLLQKYEIKKPLLSYHQHSKIGQVDKILNLLEEGKSLALVSDAGTPGISDPGNYLVQKIVEHFGEKAKIIPIPGASSVTALASVSGMPTDNFLFLGFLPHKKGRQTLLKEVLECKRTVILFESCHRIQKLLKELVDLGERQVVLGRELTKKFESIYRGTVTSVAKQLEDDIIKGEFVVVIAGKK